MFRCPSPLIGSIVALAALALGSTAPGPPPPHALPPVDAKADYQLGGNYRLPDGVRVVSRDRPLARRRRRALQHLLRQRLPDPARPAALVARAPPAAPAAQQRPTRPRPGLARRGAARHLDVEQATDHRERHRRLVRPLRIAIDFDAVEPDNLDSFSRSQAAAHPRRTTWRWHTCLAGPCPPRGSVDRAEEPGRAEPGAADRDRVRLRRRRGVLAVAGVRALPRAPTDAT